MTAQMVAGLTAAGVLVISAAVLGEKVVTRQAMRDRVTVVYWEKWTGQEGEEMQKVVNAFNKSQNRIFVKYLSISGVDQKTLLATAGGDPPDVAGIWQERIAQFADAKALTELTPLANAAGLTPDYYIKGFYDPLIYHGKLWALPSTPASVALCVRQDLVPAEVNTPEKFPKTIEAMDALVKQISTKNRDGSIKMAGILPSNPGWWNWAYPILFGGQIAQGDKVTFDTPAGLRSLKWYESYAKLFGSKEVQNLQSGFGNFASPQDPFMSGKVALEQNGVWKGNYIRVYAPNTKWFAVPFPYPADRPDLEGHSNLSQDILVIPRGCKHIPEAFEFIKYVQRQDVMEGLCIGHGKNSPLTKVSEHFFKVHPNPYIRLFDQLARSPKAFTTPVIGFWPQANDEINNAFQAVNTETKTPEVAIKDAQKRIDTLSATYRRQILGQAQ